jgi:hypothetical protein
MTFEELGLNNLLKKSSNNSTLSLDNVSVSPSLNETSVEKISDGDWNGNISINKGYLQSKNFVAGTSGWKLNDDGTFYAVNAVISGTITATSGSIGGWSVSSNAIYFDGATDALSAGLSPADYPFYAGKKYANRASAPFRVSSSGDAFASSITISRVLTAGETITGATTPQAVYVNPSDNKVYICDGNDADKLRFVGFAITSANADASVNIQFNDVVSGFTGLTEGEYYYLQDDKTIGVNPGTYFVQLGIAISSTQLLINFQLGTKVSASDNEVTTNSANTSTGSLTYVKLKETKYNDVSGTIRVKFKMTTQTSTSDLVYGRIYKNGVAYGTEWSTNQQDPAYDEFTDDLSFSSGDLIQLYGKSSSGTSQYFKDFKLCYTKSLIETPNTNTLT